MVTFRMIFTKEGKDLEEEEKVLVIMELSNDIISIYIIFTVKKMNNE